MTDGPRIVPDLASGRGWVILDGDSPISDYRTYVKQGYGVLACATCQTDVHKISRYIKTVLELDHQVALSNFRCIMVDLKFTKDTVPFKELLEFLNK